MFIQKLRALKVLLEKICRKADQEITDNYPTKLDPLYLRLLKETFVPTLKLLI
jgi:hypothetical protein